LIAERAAVSNLVQRLQLPGFQPTQREKAILERAGCEEMKEVCEEMMEQR
jgi:hypothetical protein